MFWLMILALALWPSAVLAQTAPTQAEVDALKARVEALERADQQRQMDMINAINQAAPYGGQGPILYVPPRPEPHSLW